MAERDQASCDVCGGVLMHGAECSPAARRVIAVLRSRLATAEAVVEAARVRLRDNHRDDCPGPRGRSCNCGHSQLQEAVLAFDARHLRNEEG